MKGKSCWLICALISLCCLTPQCAEAKSSSKSDNHKETWKLTDEQYEWHNEQFNIALDDGNEYFKMAYSLCHSLPKKKDKEKAIKLFKNVVFKSLCLRDCVRQIQSLIASLEKEKINVYGEYNVIKDCLNHSKYCFEIALYHLRVLKKDGRGPTKSEK